MKKLLLFGSFFVFMGLTSFAQETGDDVVTDEELKKFATVEVMTAEFVADKNEELKKMIVDNEIFQGGARYNEIKAAWGNEAKLAEIEVTEEEKAAYQEVDDFVSSLMETVKEYKTELIMDEEVLGAGTYNKVNGALKSDPVLKEKMDNMVAEIRAERGEGGEG